MKSTKTNATYFKTPVNEILSEKPAISYDGYRCLLPDGKIYTYQNGTWTVDEDVDLGSMVIVISPAGLESRPFVYGRKLEFSLVNSPFNYGSPTANIVKSFFWGNVGIFCRSDGASATDMIYIDGNNIINRRVLTSQANNPTVDMARDNEDNLWVLWKSNLHKFGICENPDAFVAISSMLETDHSLLFNPDHIAIVGNDIWASQGSPSSLKIARYRNGKWSDLSTVFQVQYSLTTSDLRLYSLKSYNGKVFFSLDCSDMTNYFFTFDDVANAFVAIDVDGSSMVKDFCFFGGKFFCILGALGDPNGDACIYELDYTTQVMSIGGSDFLKFASSSSRLMVYYDSSVYYYDGSALVEYDLSALTYYSSPAINEIIMSEDKIYIVNNNTKIYRIEFVNAWL